MINTEKAVDALIEEHNIVEFVGVGEEKYLTNLIKEAKKRCMYRDFLNEGDAVAYAVGRQIASPNSKVCILIRSSAFGNMVNPIITLSEIYEIPLLVIIGFHEYNKALTPEEDLAEITLQELIKNCTMYTGGAILQLNPDYEEILPVPEDYKEGSLFYLVSSTEVFSQVDFPKDEGVSSEISILDVFEQLNNLRKDGSKFILVSSAGETSKQSYGFDDPLNFYAMGGVGCAWSIANGLEKNKQNLPVICVDGDGSYWMRSSSAKTFSGQDTKCVRIILNNGLYDSPEGITTLEDLKAMTKVLGKWIESGADWDGDPIVISIKKMEVLPKISYLNDPFDLRWRIAKEIDPEIQIPKKEDPDEDYSLPFTDEEMENMVIMSKQKD